jgi:hypothetical protein
MNKHIIALAVVAAMGITGCSSTKSPAGSTNLPQPTETRTAVKDQVVAAHFRDRGIEVHYSMMGKLEKVVVWGVAPAWKANYDVLAELDAKTKLVKFVHGETISNEIRAEIISRGLDKARDNTLNRFDSNTSQAADFSFDAAQIEAEIQRGTPAPVSDDNTSRKIADRVERTMLNTVQTLTSSGRLAGVVKVDDGRSRDGKYYFARYEWSDRTQDTGQYLRGRMQ